MLFVLLAEARKVIRARKESKIDILCSLRGYVAGLGTVRIKKNSFTNGQ